MNDGLMYPKRRAKSLADTVFCLLAIFSLIGCASAPPPVVPVPLIISIQADSNVNPDMRGRPSPVKVVIYELKSAAAFESADFFSLSQKDQASIGADLLGREEIFLRPGENRTIVRKGNAGTSVIGVFVEFRDIDKSVWRATSLIPTAEVAGMFSSLRGAPKEKPYQVLLEQARVRIVPLPESFSIARPKVVMPSVAMPTVNMPSVSMSLGGMPAVNMPSVTMPSITLPSAGSVSWPSLPTVIAPASTETASTTGTEGQTALPSLPADAAPAGDGLGALKGMTR